MASNSRPPTPVEMRIPNAPARLNTPTIAPRFILGASWPNSVVAAKKAHCCPTPRSIKKGLDPGSRTLSIKNMER